MLFHNRGILVVLELQIVIKYRWIRDITTKDKIKINGDSNDLLILSDSGDLMILATPAIKHLNILYTLIYMDSKISHFQPKICFS